ncbi:MAG: DNA polymerase IV [Deltaproteobacteria bacterium]|nr:DNA polymerase IV [Deltaproteobacteria bacterium]
MPSSHRNIVHLHIPALPIAVARVSRPELRQRPVAVAASPSGRSLILSASAEARREGVFKGMTLDKARKRCYRLMVLLPDPGPVEKACQGLVRSATRYTPVYEPARPGHLYLDLTGTQRLWGSARDTAWRLRREVRQDLGLSATVGVAGNKMVSHIASRIRVSEGISDVAHGREASFMAPLKVGMIPGIGPLRRKVLLEELNVVRVRHLAALDMGSLKLIFGRNAYLIHQRALGIDHSPVYPRARRPVISEEVTLPRDENDDSMLLGLLYTLVERCSYRMRKRGLMPEKAGLSIRYADRKETERQIRLPPLNPQTLDLCGPLGELFFKLCKRRVRVGFMRVWFRGLHPPGPQLGLFHAPSRDERGKIMITCAMDRIRERYGENAIMYGRVKA